MGNESRMSIKGTNTLSTLPKADMTPSLNGFTLDGKNY